MEVDANTPDLVTVGVEGSPVNHAMLRWAAGEALAHHRPLCVYHCWQAPVLALVPGSAHATHDTAVAARLVIEDAVEWLRVRYPLLVIDGKELEGPPGRRLVSHVRQRDALVLGLGSRHRLAARVLGSTVEYALRHARSSVVVVPPTERVHRTNGGTGSFAGHVVAAVDDTDAASAVVGTGFAEAAAHGWPLAIVHAHGHSHATQVSLTGQAGLVTRVPKLTGVVESWHARYPQVTMHLAIVGGPPAAALEHACAGARLLVLGRTSHPLRPVRLTDLLLARINCPINLTPL